MTTVKSWINYTWITINVVYHFISENYKEIISELKVLGDSTYNISLVQKAATDTTLCHYGLSQCSTLSEARVISWERKMARNGLEPPKLCSLPPTDTSFKENVLRAHLAAAIMKSSLDSDPLTLTLNSMDGIPMKDLTSYYQLLHQKELTWLLQLWLNWWNVAANLSHPVLITSAAASRIPWDVHFCAFVIMEIIAIINQLLIDLLHAFC